MKTLKSLSGLLSASALAVGLAVIALPAAAGIVGSKHDMPGSKGSGVAGTDQICVFCHTPHGSNTEVKAPIWNKGLPPGTAYTAYTSSTMDGVAAVGSVSLACLSCHDGTQARDNMINKPGSGGYSAPDAGGSGGENLGTIGDMSALGVVNLSRDLSNDHPIGMRYCGAQTDALAIAGTCQDDSFNNASGVTGAVSVRGGTVLTPRIWLDTDGNGTYSKTDFPLYGAGSPGTNVECATCHDPHTPGTDLLNNAVGAGQTALFLRKVGGNAGSGVCLTCHNK